MRRAAMIAVLISLPLSWAAADIYRSIDSQGHVQYSDTPSPGAELISTASLRSLDSSAANNSSKDSSLAKENEQVNQQLSQQAAARAVQKDTTDARTKQCKQAQDNYTHSIEARRLYKTGADGERQFLSDDEADQQRVTNRLAMETACEGVDSEPPTSSASTPPAAQ